MVIQTWYETTRLHDTNSFASLLNLIHIARHRNRKTLVGYWVIVLLGLWCVTIYVHTTSDTFAFSSILSIFFHRQTEINIQWIAPMYINSYLHNMTWSIYLTVLILQIGKQFIVNELFIYAVRSCTAHSTNYRRRRFQL